MGLISGLVDAIILVFSAVLAIATPLIDSQTIVPSHLYPSALIELKQWYRDQYGDYLMQEEPHFFVGLVWVEILFLWPLCLLNIYGILRRKNWVKTTLIMAGVCSATSMACIMAELLGSGRASDKLLQMYVPFVAFAVLATLRGLFPPRRRSSSAASTSHSSRKKRV
ncbi:transmembrane protein 97 [Asparagus officinalis]|uniref:transmembrane protein 97 n=1 Tax=Asparagus officinalis TaxID=4686 RepID=UPI00098E2057|nr:transmembrane protein 97 [Asparagus officinalis]